MCILSLLNKGKLDSNVAAAKIFNYFEHQEKKFDKTVHEWTKAIKHPHILHKLYLHTSINGKKIKTIFLYQGSFSDD